MDRTSSRTWTTWALAVAAYGCEAGPVADDAVHSLKASADARADASDTAIQYKGKTWSAPQAAYQLDGGDLQVFFVDGNVVDFCGRRPRTKARTEILLLNLPVTSREQKFSYEREEQSVRVDGEEKSGGSFLVMSPTGVQEYAEVSQLKGKLEMVSDTMLDLEWSAVVDDGTHAKGRMKVPSCSTMLGTIVVEFPSLDEDSSSLPESYWVTATITSPAADLDMIVMDANAYRSPYEPYEAPVGEYVVKVELREDLRDGNFRIINSASSAVQVKAGETARVSFETIRTP